ncbi:MAG: Ig-like domain-containing protein [Alphaproteobacteria bacterium]|nr:Ig-like domain-containing protein [Alphaproteobacteria bacterium]
MAAEKNNPEIVQPLNLGSDEPQGQKVLGDDINAQGALGATALKVGQPSDNIAEVVGVQSGETYVLDFPEGSVIGVSLKGSDLLVEFQNGASIVLKNYQAASDVTLQLANGQAVSPDQLLTYYTALNNAPSQDQLEAPVQENTLEQTENLLEQQVAQVEAPQVMNGIEQLTEMDNPLAVIEKQIAEDQAQLSMDQTAQQLSQVEPAAGEGASPGGSQNSGFGFGSSFESQGVIGLSDVGPIDPTLLEYGVQQPQDDVRPQSRFSSGPAPITPDIIPKDPESDPPYQDLVGDYKVYEDGSVQLLLTATPDLQGSVLTITIQGIPSTWTVDPTVGTYSSATGTWVYVSQPGEVFTGGPIVWPPADSDVDLNNLIFRVVEFNQATNQTGSATKIVDVIVDAVADAPDVDAPDNTGEEGVPLDVTITGQAGDTDGSEVIVKYQISDVPNGFSFNKGTPVGNGVWEFTPAEIIGLQAIPPSNTYNGSINLKVTIFTTENPVSDRDFDDTNDNATAEDPFTLTWTPDEPPPVVCVYLPEDPNSGVKTGEVYEDNSIEVRVTGALPAGGTADAVLTMKVSGIDLTKLDNLVLEGEGNAQWIRVPNSPDTAAEFTLTLAPNTGYGGIFTFTPKAQSDLDLTNMTVTATSYEPGTNTTVNSNVENFAIIVDAVADDPSIVAGDASGDEGETLAISIAGQLGVDNFDGSESITGYQIKGDLTGFTFVDGANNPIGTKVSDSLWTFTPAEIGNVHIVPPSATYTGSVNLTAVVLTVDTANDTDFDTTNDTDSAEDPFTVVWNNDDAPTNVNASETVDETGLDITETGTVAVNYGTDGPGKLTITGDFTPSGSLANNALTSGGVAVTIGLAAIPGWAQYEGYAGNTLVFTLKVFENGNYEYKQFEPLDHANGSDPDDIITLTFGITATDNDNDATNGSIVINVKDDAPVAVNDGDYVVTAGQVASGNVTANDNLSNDVVNTITSVFELDAGYIVPQNGSVSIPGLYGTLVMFSDGSYTYTANSGNVDGTDSFLYTLVDSDGDSSRATLSFDVNPLPPQDDQPDAINDNGGLITTIGTVKTGNVMDNDDKGDDLPTIVTHVDGQQVGVNGLTINGQYGTLIIQQNGSYTYTSTTHGVGVENFIYTITDVDGDSDSAVLYFNFNCAPPQDDQPDAINDNGGLITTINTIKTGNVMTNDDKGDDLPTIVTHVNNQVVGQNGLTINGQYGTLVIQQDGSYTYTSTSTAVGVENFIYTITDVDGDSDSAILYFTLNCPPTPVDDQPDAVNDNGGSVTNVNDSKTGNVMGNDDKGDDLPTVVTKIGNFDVGVNGLTINGLYGTLTIQQDGSYTYTRTSYGSGVEKFPYTITDVDGDSDSAILCFTIPYCPPPVPDDQPIVYSAAEIVDETGLNITETGTVNVNYGNDGPGKVTINGDFSASGSLLNNALTSGGVAITVNQTAIPGYMNYEGYAGNTKVFSLKVYENGNYEYKQFAALDHANASDPNDIISLHFGITATDTDNDATNGKIIINVKDDAPVAVNDGTYTVNAGQAASGNVMTNDHVSKDVPNKVISVFEHDAGYIVPANGSVSIPGLYGTLVMYSNGTYTYTAKTGNIDGVDTFRYTLADHDGDSSYATLSFDVNPSITPPPPPPCGCHNDDQPVAVDDNGGTIIAINTVKTGNVMTNDDKGNDIPTIVTKVGNVNISVNGTTINGQYGTLFIKQDGSYTYTSTTHAVGQEQFTYTITDKDGDSSSAKLSFTFNCPPPHVDDQPDAVNDNGGSVHNVNVTTIGNVMTNDDKGNDLPTIVTHVNGQFVGINGLTINGIYGTLTIQHDGSYSYTRTSYNSGVENFTYTITDVDGDADSAVLCFTIPPCAPPPPPPPPLCDVDVVINNGVDKLCIKEDGTGTLPVSVTYNGGDGDEVVTLVLTGIANNWGVTAPGWTKVGNEYRITLPTGQTTYNGNITLSPPTNSDVDLGTVRVTASVYDPDTTQTVTSFDTANIQVDAVADAINLNTPGSITFRSRSTSGALKIGATLTDTDGSEVITKFVVSFSGSTMKMSLNRGTKIANNKWEITVVDGDVNAAVQNLKMSFANYTAGFRGINGNGKGKLTVSVYSEEKNLSGEECDTSDNTRVVTKTFNFQIVASPLVFDIDHDGIELTSLQDGVLFDITEDGVKDHTAWVKGDDALLALDVNGDGVINDRGELFGDNDLYEDGFAKLASFDSNKDGLIDAQDDVFADLRLWQDLNQDGISQADELHGLVDMGIRSINLDAAEVDYSLEGNPISHEGTFTRDDGTIGQVVDAWFESRDGATEETPVELYGNDNAADVFVLGESGNIINNFNAYEGDQVDLSELLTNFDPLQDSINDFVFATQSGVDTILSVDVNGRGDASMAIDVAVLADRTLTLEELQDNKSITA